MGTDAEGFAKANLNDYSRGRMLFLSISARQTNTWKGKKYWISVGYFEDCNKRSTKYIYRMPSAAWIEDETDSVQIYLPNAEDEMGLTQMFTE